jgi:hypothetical protein
MYRNMYDDTVEHYDIMALKQKLIDMPDRAQTLTQKSAEALEYRSSTEHGKEPCQDRKLQYNVHMSFRDIGPRGMCRGHRDVDLVAPRKGLEGLKYASLHIISILR